MFDEYEPRRSHNEAFSETVRVTKANLNVLDVASLIVSLPQNMYPSQVVHHASGSPIQVLRTDNKLAEQDGTVPANLCWFCQIMVACLSRPCLYSD